MVARTAAMKPLIAYVRKAVPGLCLAACLLLPRVASAQPSANEKAAAEALFRQGTELSAEERFREACVKFEGSQRLDPALGTMLHLADCYDRIGKTASAWAMFTEAAAIARSTNQPEREQIATARADDLERRLSRLTLELPADTPAGLEVRLNGAAIPEATWNAPIPVDPGLQTIEVAAPGHEAWSGSVDVPVGPVERSFSLPRLVPVAEAAPEPAVAGPSAPAVPIDTGVPRARGGVQRTLGYVASAVGIVGLGVGGYFGYRAYDLNDQSLAFCRRDDANACTARGAELRDEARRNGNLSTIAVGAGAALLAGGVVLLVTAPKRAEPQKAASSLRVAGAPRARGLELFVEGAF